MKKILSAILILCLLITSQVSVFADQRLVASQSGEWTVLTEVVNNSYGYFEFSFFRIKGAEVTTWTESRYIDGFGYYPLYVVEAKGECTIRHCNNELSIRSDEGEYFGNISEVYLDKDEVTLPIGAYTVDVNIGGDGMDVRLYVTAPDPVFATEPSAFELPEASVILNGNIMVLDQSAVIIDARVMVPVRAIFEAMGLTLNWNDITRTITATKEGMSIVMSIDNRVAYLNGEAYVLDVAPQILNERTLVPVRFVSESVGADVSWNDAEKQVTITY